MNLNERVLAMQDDLLKTLQESIRIPSVHGPAAEGAPYGAEVRQSLDHILKSAEALGFSTVNMDGQVGWCEYGEGTEMVAVLGHLDVVPAGDGWSFDPWGGEIKNDRIFGRGTMDDKGPSVKKHWHIALAVAAFVVVALLKLSPVYVVVACAVLSFIFGKKINQKEGKA